MSKTESVLFKVLVERGKVGLETEFIRATSERVKSCVFELLAVLGYAAQPILTVENLGNQNWYFSVNVAEGFHAQLDLFLTRGDIPTVRQVASEVVEAAMVAVARFRRESAGITASTLQETLKQLRSADPRVIAALSKQPGGRLTLRKDEVDFELSIQSDAKRKISPKAETLSGVILAVGLADLFVLPGNRRSPGHLCLHPFRVKVPSGLRDLLDPKIILEEFVIPRHRVGLAVQLELAARHRRQRTYVLVDWPELRLSERCFGPAKP